MSLSGCHTVTLCWCSVEVHKGMEQVRPTQTRVRNISDGRKSVEGQTSATKSRTGTSGVQHFFALLFHENDAITIDAPLVPD